MIMGAVPGSPAAAAGLSGKFIVRSIDGQSVEGLGLQDCVNLLRGPVDTKVRLEVMEVDATESRTVELTRRQIQI